MVGRKDEQSLARGTSGGAAAPGPVPGLLDGLNPPQREAVTCAEGPLLILAGPGSGKTRVVTQRIAWLITERGARPEEILALTFTNKAAREMRERVERTLDAARMWISTFHAMCARILRREIELLGGWTRDFSIYDTSDRNALLKSVVKASGYDLTRYRPGLVGGWISAWKNTREPGSLPPAEGGMDDEVLGRVMRAYSQALRSNNALDFDDLLLKVLELFDGHAGVRDAYASRFRYVSVDEYQDTNRVQYLLTRHLSSYHGNLAVCGDPDQSIYAWRGADLRNILDFERDFPSPRVVKLEQNYRSKGNILKAAHALIRANSARKEKALWTESEDGDLLTVLECADENDEAREIALQVRALALGGVPYDSIAVFYRVNFMQRALETQLRLARVPYQIVGGVEFYARREIRDLVSYLKLAVNPNDDVAFRRVVNVPRRGVGEQSVERLMSWALDRRVPLLEALRSPEALESIRGRARAGLAAFGELLGRLAEARELPASSALELLLEEIDCDSWLAQMDDDDAGAEREANVDELVTHAREYDRLYPDGGLRGFLQDIALVSDVDGLREGSGGVALMTLHSAKGLEFPVAIIAGLEEELLPHFRALAEGEGDAGLEQERRLLYVGMTRARERLLLTWAANRLHFGQESSRLPSRFLDEIPPELIEGLEHDRDGERDPLGVFEAPEGEYASLKVGDAVEHDHFGRGRVELLQGSGVNARATVCFVDHGNKQLLLQYARLRLSR